MGKQLGRRRVAIDSSKIRSSRNQGFSWEAVSQLKCHGSVRTAKKTPLLRSPETFGQNLIAYTDERNSGGHLFDPNQPEFWTGTLVTPPNFEATAASVVAECLAVVGQHELHGNALGLSGIDKIGDKLGRSRGI